MVDTPGYAWIEDVDILEDGHGAHCAWYDHFNGCGELDKHTALSLTPVNSLNYQNEPSFSFEKYCENLK